MGLGGGDRTLLRQLAVTLGCSADCNSDAELGKLLTGEDDRVTELLPELLALRDVAYYFKVCSPPPSHPAMPPATTTTWRSSGGDGSERRRSARRARVDLR